MASDGGFEDTQKGLSDAVVNITRTTTRIAAEDLSFHRSSNPSLGSLLDEKSTRLLRITEKIVRKSTAASRQISLRNVDDIDSVFPVLVDVADSLLERADICLDQFSGLLKRPATDLPEDAPIPKARKLPENSRLSTSKIVKPQLQFEAPPYNHEATPFRPFLSSKPHAKISLEKSLKLEVNQEERPQYEHPYQKEIEEFGYGSDVYENRNVIPYLPFDSTKATWVDDFDGVLSMLHELKEAKEIAIDLEHHEVHSYIGIVCLMQISTRDRDWIIDTLKPWRRKLEVLNEVFTDPTIIKVLHGAHMDVIWLQRDLGLYLVGLFDTHHASRVLHYQGGSLAFLLKKFIDFDAQKQYQTADWRLRPLPVEMFEYARSDTHFLLYIYDRMRNELLEQSEDKLPGNDLIQDVLDRSKNVALNRYEHPFYNDTYAGGRNSWFSLLSKHPTDLSKEQIAVFARVHRWRDTVARQEDEGVNFIMPVHVIFSIARAMPKDRASLLGASHPISPPVRTRIDELFEVVKAAIANAPNFPSIPATLTYGFGMRSSKAGAMATNDSTTAHSPTSLKVTDLDLRMSTSRLWGHTLTSRDSNPPNIVIPAFTIPVLSSSSITLVDAIKSPNNPVEARSDEVLDEGTENHHLPIGNTHAHGKRKTLSPSNAKQSIEANDFEEAQAVLQVQQRAARKAAKKARKIERDNMGAMNGDNSGMTGSQPFDYDAAPTVLNAGIAAKPQQQANPPKQAIVNPYAKGEAAPAGLKRVQNMKTGKSSTFK